MINCILKDMRQPESYVIFSLALAIAIYIFLRLIQACLSLKQMDKKRSVKFIVAVLYMVVMVRTVYFSRPFHSRYGMNMAIMGTWGTTSQSHAYVIENLILFIPFGILFPLCQPKRKSAAICILCACILSIFIEILQWITKRGYCELDDVMMNSLGAAVGWGIYKMFNH